MKPVFPLVVAMSLVACGSPKSAPAEAAAQPQVATPAQVLPQGRRVVMDAEAPPAEPAPEGVAELDSLLRAWHKEDLPTKEALDAHTDADRSLMWLGRYGETMSVRVRALNLLRYYPDPETADLLVEVASDASAHPSLQAAAIRGMAGQDLTADARLRDAAVNGLSSSDVRVGLAAVDVLATVDDENAKTALLDAANSDATSEKVRDAAKAAAE